MRVLPITSYNPNHTAFTHHPDFEKLAQTEPIKASCFFRRDGITSSDSFLDIIKVFKTMFEGEIKTPKKMLIVGVADSQEPFSYLTAISQIRKDKPIEELLDLYIVDLQSAPNKNKLHKDSYAIEELIPNYARGGFIKSMRPSSYFYSVRVRDDLFKFLKNTYNNPEKSKWESRIQEVIKDYPDNYFDIVSMNNVIFYLPNRDKSPTMENIYRTIKKGGLYITEGDLYVNKSTFASDMERINYGIFKKIK